jgi:hypothetical protein
MHPFNRPSDPAPRTASRIVATSSVPLPGVSSSRLTWSRTLVPENAPVRRPYLKLCSAKRSETIRSIIQSKPLLTNLRYVSELAKMKEAFIIPLLHPFSSTSASSQSSARHWRTSLGGFSRHGGSWRARSSESLEHISIASRSFASLVAGPFTTSTPRLTESNDDLNDTSAYRKPSKNSTPRTVSFIGATSLCQLPEDLRICLEVIENDLLEGHVRFSEALNSCYEEQLPLVRSLEDVLVKYVGSFITTFVYHWSMMSPSPTFSQVI